MSWTLKKENGDIFVSPDTGRPVRVFNEEKTSQDVADILMTEFDPERSFGSKLPKLPGEVQRPTVLGPFGAARVQDEVKDTIQRLISLQDEMRLKLAPTEAIEEIHDIQVYQINKTSYLFRLRVKLFSNREPRDFSFKIKLGHQFVSSNKRNLPGFFNSDDIM